VKFSQNNLILDFIYQKKTNAMYVKKIKNTHTETLSEVQKKKFEKHKSDAALSKDVPFKKPRKI